MGSMAIASSCSATDYDRAFDLYERKDSMASELYERLFVHPSVSKIRCTSCSFTGSRTVSTHFPHESV